MDYPLQLTTIRNDFSLYLPIPGEIRAAYEKTLSNGVDTPFPFWARVWPSSKALTSYLLIHQELIQNKKVLEIGAGTGLPSFSIARIAASVIISDHSAEAVELMEKNIAHLGLLNTTALLLDWNDVPNNLPADIVLLSDINYAPGQFEPLLKLIRRLIEEGTTIVIATPQRLMGVSFLLPLESYIRLNETMVAEGVDISILVLLK